MKKLTDEQKNKHPEVESMLDELGQATAIIAVAESEGGKALVSALITDVVSSVDTLCARYSSLTVQQFISLCADMKSKIDLVRAIKRSKKSKESLESLISETLSE